MAALSVNPTVIAWRVMVRLHHHSHSSNICPPLPPQHPHPHRPQRTRHCLRSAAPARAMHHPCRCRSATHNMSYSIPAASLTDRPAPPLPLPVRQRRVVCPSFPTPFLRGVRPPSLPPAPPLLLLLACAAVHRFRIPMIRDHGVPTWRTVSTYSTRTITLFSFCLVFAAHFERVC